MAKNSNYISARESRKITRENRKITAEIEKKRNRKHIPESEYITQMKDPNNCVEFDNVHTYFFTDIGTVKAVDGVSFEVPVGKTVGIVGESGCGKSVTSLSLMQLVQRPAGQTVEGEIRFNTGKEAVNVVNAPASYMQKLRGNSMGMIFQEPMTSLNPVFRIGDQVDEVIKLHNPDMTKEQVKARTIEMLQLVGIANKEGVYKMYPHELSGGMRQRIMIAMALACDPKLIIADEPTTALDVTVQAQILELLQKLTKERGSSVIIITHDLGVVATMCDRIAIMYAGQIVEEGTVDEIFYHAKHPYTKGLLNSINNSEKDDDEPLVPIPGTPPDLTSLTGGCAFMNRCPNAMKVCAVQEGPVTRYNGTHFCRCWLENMDESLIKVKPMKTVDVEPVRKIV